MFASPFRRRSRRRASSRATAGSPGHLTRRLLAEQLEDRRLLAVLFSHDADDAVRAIAPSEAAYNNLGLDWTGGVEPFDDSAWAVTSGAPNGVGYDLGDVYDPLIGADLEAAMHGASPTLFVRAAFDVDDPSAVDLLTLDIRYDDGYIAWINGIEVARANAATVYPAWSDVATAEHQASTSELDTIDLADAIANLRAGTNVIAIRGLNDSIDGDDALIQFTLTGESRTGPPLAVGDAATTQENTPVVIDVLANDQEGSSPINPQSVAVATPPAHGTAVANGDGTITYTPNTAYNGQDTFTYTVRDGTGVGQPTNVTLVAANAPARALVPADDSLGTTWRGGDEPFDDIAWQSGALGVGYERSSGYESYIGLDVSGANTSVYVRSTFTIENPADVTALALRMRYDDGFAAFINGVAVASANSPGELSYDSASVGDHPDSAAIVFETFDLSTFASALRPGTNILAIHGLNSSTASSDMLIQPELTATIQPRGQLSNAATVTVDVEGIDFAPIARDDDYAVEEGETLIAAVLPGGGEPATQTIVPSGAVWRYYDYDGGQVPPVDGRGDDWKQAVYDDASWPSGPAQLGYGDGDEATVLPYGGSNVTAWFRHRFTVDSLVAARAESLVIELLRDDGAAVYLNGVEIVRDNLPGAVGDAAVEPTALATVAVAGADEARFYSFTIDLTSPRLVGVLRQGVNVLAVEVHQIAVTSSDLSFDLRASVELAISAGVLGNDTEPDGQDMTAVLETPPASGTLDLAADGTFTYTPDAGFVGVDTFAYRATDGLLFSDPATVTITVEHVAPIANDDAYTTDESTPLVIDAVAGVLANDTDTQGHALTAALATQPAHGTVTVNADGSFTYTPTLGYNGQDSFTYTASDGARASNSATVTILVAPLTTDFGDAPLPYPTTLAENGARHSATGPMLGAGRDADIDGTHANSADYDPTDDGITVSSIRVGQLGALATVDVRNAPFGARLDAWIDFNRDGAWGGPGEQIANGTLVVDGANAIRFDVPSSAASGQTFARFRLSTAGSLGVRGPAVDGEVEDYAIAILPPLESQGEFADAKATGNGPTTLSSVAAADVDGDGDMDVLATTRSSPGVVWYENDGAQYYTERTIATDSGGPQSASAVDVDGDGDLDLLVAFFSDWRIAWYENDGAGAFTPRTVTTAAGQPDAVFAVDMDGDGDIDVLSASRNSDRISWFENDGNQNFTPHTVSTAVVQPTSVHAADVDGDGDMDLVSASYQDGKVAWYENDGNQSFSTRVITSTANGASSAVVADIDLDGDMDVVAVASADDAILWYENRGDRTFTAHTVVTEAIGASFVAAGDLDGDGDLDLLSGSVANDLEWYENDGGQSFLVRTIGTAAYRPLAVSIADADGDGDLDILSGPSRLATFAWYENAIPVCDACTDIYSVNEDSVLVVDASNGLLANDGAQAGEVLTASIASPPGHGQLVLLSDGSYTYAPNSNYAGEDAFVYRVSSNQRGPRDVVVTITVNSINDVPIAVDDTFTIDRGTSLALSAPSPVTETMAATSFAEPATGAVSFVAAGGELGFNADTTPSATELGVLASDEYIVRGVSSPLLLTFDAVDIADYRNVAVRLDLRTFEDSSGSDFEENDFFRAQLGLTRVGGPVVLQTIVDLSGVQLKALDNGQSGAYTTFTATIPDGFLTATLTIETSVDSSTERVFFDNIALTGFAAAGGNALLANDSDADGDTLSIRIVTPPVHGVIETDGAGAMVYTPDPLYVGDDTFTYVASDGEADSNESTVTIHVLLANLVPTAADDAYATNEDEVLVVPAGSGLLANDDDLDGDLLTVRVVDGPVHGTLDAMPDGSFTYTPAANYFGADGFTYVASDGRDDSAIASVSINITAVNDAPNAIDDAYSVSQDDVLSAMPPSYSQTVLASSPLAYWRLGESAGQTAIDQTGRFPGQYISGVSLFEAGALFRDTDTAARFDGTTGYVRVPYSSSLNLANDFTVEAWVKPNTVTGQSIILGNHAGPAGYGVGIFDRRLTFTTYGILDYRTQPILETGQWYHIAIAFDASNDATFYVNGQFVETIVGNRAANSSGNPLFLGAAPNLEATAPGELFRGTLDEVAIFNRVLSPGEILAHFASAVAQSQATEQRQFISRNSTWHYRDDIANGSPYPTNAQGGQWHHNNYDDSTWPSGPGILGYDAIAAGPVATQIGFGGDPNFKYLTALFRRQFVVDDADRVRTLTINMLADDGAAVYVNGREVLRYNLPGDLGDGFLRSDTPALTTGDESAYARFDIDLADFPDLLVEGTNTIAVEVHQVSGQSSDLGFDLDLGALLLPERAASGVLGNDTDVEGDVLAAELVAGPQHGVLELNADGTFTYTPAVGYYGDDSFTYRAFDGAAYSNVATVAITVHRRLVAVDDAYSTAEDTLLVVPRLQGVLANDPDFADRSVTAVLEAAPLHGSVTLAANGALHYRPAADFFGTDSFTYRTTDGGAVSEPATVTVTVMAVNDAPAANRDVYAVAVGETLDAASAAESGVIADSFAEFSGIQGQDGWYYGYYNRSADGNGTYQPGEFTAFPNAAGGWSAVNFYDVSVGRWHWFNGDPPWTAISDDNMHPNGANNGAEHWPIRRWVSDTSGPVTISGSLRLVNPSDQTGVTAYVIVDGISVFTRTIQAGNGATIRFLAPAVVSNGSTVDFVISPDGNEVSDTTQFIATIGEGVAATEELLPRLSTWKYRDDISPSTPYPVDGDGDSWVETGYNDVSWPSGPGILGYDRIDAGPVATNIGFGGNSSNKHHTALFRRTFQVDDADRVVSLTFDLLADDSAAVHVNGVEVLRHNLPGVVGDGSLRPDTLASVTGDESGYSTTPVDLSVFPGLLVNGMNTVAVEVHQVLPTSSDLGFDLAITATYAPDPASAGVLGNDTDAEGDAITALLVAGPYHGLLEFSADGTFTYTPDAGFEGVDQFTYRAGDGAADSRLALVTINVGEANVAPLAADDRYVTRGGSLSVPAEAGVLANDFDLNGDALTATVFTPPTRGTLLLVADGGFVYVPEGNFRGVDTFTYRVADDAGTFGFATATIHVLAALDPINAIPSAGDDAFFTTVGGLLNVAAPGVLANDEDGELRPLYAVVEQSPWHGTLSFAADGSFIYTPRAGFAGSDSFTYRATDGNTFSPPATVTIAVEPAMPSGVLQTPGDSTGTTDTGSTSTPLLADLNGDGRVDRADLAVVVAAYGSTSTLADLNGDGRVSVADAIVLRNAMAGQSSTPLGMAAGSVVQSAGGRLAPRAVDDAMVHAVRRSIAHYRSRSRSAEADALAVEFRAVDSAHAAALRGVRTDRTARRAR